MTADPARLVTRGFIALAVATLAFFVAAGIVLPVAPTFAKEALGADETGVGVAIASFSIASLVLRPLVGWSSDRFGRRPLLIGGALLTVAALGLHLVATDLQVFFAAPERCHRNDLPASRRADRAAQPPPAVLETTPR